MSHLATGTVISGRYRVGDTLGSGGMGVVYRAVDTVEDRSVAIKVLKSDAHLERFAQEARAVAELESPHVVNVRSSGELDDGAPFLVMELLDGRTLRAVLEESGTLPVDEVVAVALQICAGLAQAHARGIVHRDLKPSNLHLHGERCLADTDHPHVCVLDFGIAKVMSPVDSASLTATGSVMGSPKYMSPEQLRDAKAVDARSDIWSIGVVLYESLTGHAPFEADSAEGLCAMIAADDAAAPSGVDAALSAVVMRCLRKKRQNRFLSVAELAEALAPFAGVYATALLADIRRALPRSDEDETIAPDERAAVVGSGSDEASDDGLRTSLDEVPPALHTPRRSDAGPPSQRAVTDSMRPAESNRPSWWMLAAVVASALAILYVSQTRDADTAPAPDRAQTPAAKAPGLGSAHWPVSGEEGAAATATGEAPPQPAPSALQPAPSALQPAPSARASSSPPKGFATPSASGPARAPLVGPPTRRTKREANRTDPLDDRR